MATIATHNGSTVRQAHNMRAASCLAKEKHIDPSRPHEIWKHETISHAYHRLFDQAREDYNTRQKRQDRKLTGSYLSEIEKDPKKHSCYEMIIGIYGDDVPEHLSKSIMKGFVDGWQDRNPNLELIGAYYHADEEGKNPHVHIDYIPVAHGYQRGPETQTGLVKALEQQGFVKKGKATAQIQWEARENSYLDMVCQFNDISVEHPQAGQNQIKHLETKIYKAEQTAKEAEITRDRLTGDVKHLKGTKEALNGKIERLSDTIDKQRNEINRLALELEDLREQKKKQAQLAARAHEKAAKAEQTADKLNDLIRQKFEALEMTAQERMPVKHKLGGREVIEIDPKELAKLQDAAAYVREAFEIKKQGERYIDQAKEEARNIVQKAEMAMSDDWFEHKLIGIQIDQIRKDWPELDRYFDQRGIYRGREWLSQQKAHPQHKHRRETNRDEIER